MSYCVWNDIVFVCVRGCMSVRLCTCKVVSTWLCVCVRLCVRLCV